MRGIGFLGIAFALGLALRPEGASALPSFAQAYHVDCSACHSMVPALNAYGRYVQSTHFGALDPTVLKGSVPLVVRESISYRSTAGLSRLAPRDTVTYANLSFTMVGAISKYVTYRLEQSVYSNNISGGSLGHTWLSYNRLMNGSGHLIIGKFDPPAPSAFSYWGDMSGFSSATIGAGQHSYNLGSQRWGAGFSYVPTDYAKHPYRAEIAWVGNSPSLLNASAFDASNPYAPGGKGSDRAFQYQLAWARPDNPVEVGVYGASGTYVLANGYRDPIDRYGAFGLYAQRDPDQHFPGVIAFYQRTNDSNIGPGKASNQLVQAATTWSYGLEVDQPFFGGNVMLGIRPVEFLGGLQASKSGYDVLGTAHPHFGTFDLLVRDPKFSPYLWLTAESAVSAASNAPFGQPVWRLGIKWASPVRGPIK
jgi:hypothetical protein